MGIYVEIAVAIISLLSFIVVVLRSRDKLLERITKMESMIVDTTAHNEKTNKRQDDKMSVLEARQQVDRGDIDRMNIKIEYQEKRLDDLQISIKEVHSRISSSTKEIMNKIDSLKDDLIRRI